MKKIPLLILLLPLFFTAYAQTITCNRFGTGDICQNFKNNNQAAQYSACCACGTSPQHTNTTGCPVNGAPINKGIIVLIMAAVAIGIYAVRRNQINQTKMA